MIRDDKGLKQMMGDEVTGGGKGGQQTAATPHPESVGV